MSLVRQHDAGRCGFVVVDPGSNGYHPREVLRMPGIVPVSDVLRVQGPHAITIQKVLPEAYVADTFEQAVSFSRQTSAPIATLDGDVLRGPHLVTGGAKVESRGILATRREIKELVERVAVDREQLARLAADVAAARADDRRSHQRDHRPAGRGACAGKGDRRATKRSASAPTRSTRVWRARPKSLPSSAARPKRSAPRSTRRRAEADASIVRLESEQRAAEERLGEAQRTLADARDTAGALGAQAAEARASHAALVERAAALGAEVLRLEEGARELELRIGAHHAELQQTHTRRESLLAVDRRRAAHAGRGHPDAGRQARRAAGRRRGCGGAARIG